MIRELLELCGTNEGKVGGVEGDDEPLAAEIREFHLFYFPLVICLEGDIRDLFSYAHHLGLL